MILGHIQDERFKNVHILYDSVEGWLHITCIGGERKRYTWKDDHLVVLDELIRQRDILRAYNK